MSQAEAAALRRRAMCILLAEGYALRDLAAIFHQSERYVRKQLKRSLK